MTTKTLFGCYLDGHDADGPFVQRYWARAAALGAALELIRQAALDQGTLGPRCLEADPESVDDLDVGDLEESPDGLVLWEPQRFHYEAGDQDGMPLPDGVVASSRAGDGDDPEAIRVGYGVIAGGGIERVELNVPGYRLLADYAHFLRAFEPFRVFWYKLHDHWEDAPADELFVNQQLTSAAAVLEHLERHQTDGLLNGFVTLTAYAGEGATNINISDHKKIVVATQAPALRERAEAIARELGYEPLDPFVTIDSGLHHWHFQPSQGRSRAELARWLGEQGFTLWKPGS